MIHTIGERVLVKRLDDEEKVGGIVIPDASRTKSHRAVVISAPDGQQDISKGDRLIISQYGGAPVKIDGEDLLILDIDSILAVESDD